MKNTLKKILLIGKTLTLLCKSLIFRIIAGSDISGKEFDSYGRILSFKFLVKGDFSRFITLLANPVSIVRYFEFPFALAAINCKLGNLCLDVSSPRLFLLYLLHKYPDLYLEIVNPDINDLNETAVYLKALGNSVSVNLSSHDVIKLPYPDNYFDAITSISVIEHISDMGDSLAMKEMWRVLKPGGKLVITVPCSKYHYEEWRDEDVYGLGNQPKNNKYFFQRFYDTNTIKCRLYDSIGIEPSVIEIFGEKQPGKFIEYEKRWLKFGIEETIKDPWYIVKDYKYFTAIDVLPGIGVCGLVFEKKGD